MTLEAWFSLAGRTALVTGGSSGIGRAVALALAAAGAHVVVAARGEAALRSTLDEVEAAGGSGATVVADLATRAGAHALADEVLGAGPVDVLVSSAGINLRPPMGEVDEGVWDATMAVNLEAPHVLGRRLAPAMVERGWGRLLAISSQQASRAFADSGAYGVSKAALEGLARSQSEAWARHGVTSNVLVPGFVPTPLNARMSSDPSLVEALAARTHVRRNGRPEDLAAAAVFLAGPGAAYVTGQCLAVDGGFSVQ